MVLAGPAARAAAAALGIAAGFGVGIGKEMTGGACAAPPWGPAVVEERGRWKGSRRRVGVRGGRRRRAAAGPPGKMGAAAGALEGGLNSMLTSKGVLGLGLGLGFPVGVAMGGAAREGGGGGEWSGRSDGGGEGRSWRRDEVESRGGPWTWC